MVGPVLHVVSGLGAGGAETQLVRIASALAQGGLPQHVVSLAGPGVHGVALAAAGVGVTLFDWRRPAGLLGGVAGLVRLTRRLRPRAVQGWMYHGDLAATLAHRLARLGPCVPLYWGLRCSDMDLTRYSAGLRAVVRACVLLSGMPDVVIANARTGLDAHLRLGYRPRASRVIPNAIDTGRFRPDPERRATMRAQLGYTDAETVFVLVARVDPMKDHAAFLSALALRPTLRGLLLGAGTETLALPPNATALGRRDDVADILTAADAIVSCSAFGEGFSNALAEGMAAGLPAIATDVGDSRAIVGAAGTIVPPRDPAALAAAMMALAVEPAQVRASMAAAARARIVDAYGMAPCIAAYAALYGTSA